MNKLIYDIFFTYKKTMLIHMEQASFFYILSKLTNFSFALMTIKTY